MLNPAADYQAMSMIRMGLIAGKMTFCLTCVWPWIKWIKILCRFDVQHGRIIVGIQAVDE